jgi:D-arabinose 1-dehydrogenase-like Zn-dependent alcohol dehydrogenase
MTITTPEVPSAASIPATMAAVMCHGPGDYRLETVPVPQPGPLEVLTSVEAVGICAGDIKTWHGAPSFLGDAEQPRYVKPPMIPGHEFIGRWRWAKARPKSTRSGSATG